MAGDWKLMLAALHFEEKTETVQTTAPIISH
jgi:hypothetical protein